MSLNSAGLGAYERCVKFKSTFLYPKFKRSPDIVCLQETHFVENMEKNVRSMWQYDLIFAHSSSTSGGLVIGFNRRLQYATHSHKELAAEKSQALFVHCTVLDVEMVIINVYIHPNTSDADRSAILARIQLEAEEFECSNFIYCGDFNAVMDPFLDSSGGHTSYHAAASASLTDFVEEGELIDSFRVYNPNARRYTCFRKATNTGRRLDYIFTSGLFMNLIKEVTIGPRRYSDHNPVYININTSRNAPGRGYWRFPEPLLQNEDFVKHMKGKIADEVQKHKCDCNASTLWDLVKNAIRRETIRFLKWDGIQDKLENERFQSKLAALYLARDRAQGATASAVDTSITKATQEWEKFLDGVNRKALEYSVGRKRQEDQKSSKYFFKRFNAIPGSTGMMYDNSGIEHTTDTAILDVCHSFYNDLYNKPPCVGDSPYAFIKDPPSSPGLLNELDRDLLADEITLQELADALKGMKKGKAPGLDGIPAVFYSLFWSEVGMLIYNSLRFAKDQGILSPSQRRGVVKLIPKRDNNPCWVRNLRPITLLNVDVKILTRALAFRLRAVIDELVQRDQQAFIQGRYLGNSLLDLYSVAARAIESDEDGLIISLDIEKAFDSVSWSFLYSLLSSYGFPAYFLDWLRTLHAGKELRIFNNGHCSKPVMVSNGLAQGCSLSPLLFILCMESLACVVRENKKIQGFEAADIQKKIGLIADDTLLSVKATQEGFTETVNVLQHFEKVSGLKVNYEKSVVCRIGSKNTVNYSIASPRQFVWLPQGHSLKYLGTKLSLDQEGNFQEDGNFVNPKVTLDRVVQSLRYAHNSMLGKVALVKTMLASLFVYRFSVLTVPSMLLDILDKYYYNFVWNGKRPTIAKLTMEQDVSNGGFKMLNVRLQEKSLKLIWIHRLLDDTQQLCFWQAQVRSAFRLPLLQILQFNLHPSRLQAFLHPGAVLPKFWKIVFNHWFRARYVSKSNLNARASDILQLPVCYNSVMQYKMEKMDAIFAELNELGIVTVDQFLRKRQQLKDNPAYAWLARKLPTHWLLLDYTVDLEETLYFGVTMQKWPVHRIYAFLRDRSFRPPTAVGSWSRELKNPISLDHWKDSAAKAALIADIPLRSFHLMFINRGYYTNHRLAKFTEQEDICRLCGDPNETLVHLYWECTHTRNLVFRLKEFCEEYLYLDMEELTRESFLFSWLSTKLLVFLCTFLKRFILIFSITNRKPVFKAFLRSLRAYIIKDKCRATYARQLNRYHTFWGILATDSVLNSFD